VLEIADLVAACDDFARAFTGVAVLTAAAGALEDGVRMLAGRPCAPSSTKPS
jgi:hypothetical protein